MKRKRSTFVVFDRRINQWRAITTQLRFNKVFLRSLIGRLQGVERLANAGDGDLTAAHEAIQVQDHRLDLAIRPGRIERGDDVGQAIFPGLRRAAAQQRGRADFGGLFTDRAVKFQQQRAGVHRLCRLGRIGQGGIERAEEEQQQRGRR